MASVTNIPSVMAACVRVVSGRVDAPGPTSNQLAAPILEDLGRDGSQSGWVDDQAVRRARSFTRRAVVATSRAGFRCVAPTSADR